MCTMQRELINVHEARHYQPDKCRPRKTIASYPIVAELHNGHVIQLRSLKYESDAIQQPRDEVSVCDKDET